MATVVSISGVFFLAFASVCVKEDPDHRQSQPHLVVPIVSTVKHLSFCSCSRGPVNGHQEHKW